MFTQPNALYTAYGPDLNGNIIAVEVPVPRNLWGFFSTKDQADTMLPFVKKVSPDAEIFDGLNLDLFIPVTYLDETTKIWVFKGTAKDPAGNVHAVDELAGSLSDRFVKPNVFVDSHVDRPAGEKTKVLVPAWITTDLAELHWTK